ncbi:MULTISPECIES: ABC transporter substrate-binding protein [unclassified Sedimentibacter]|uniref:ABC transporter substrate-binding protein n=1 Tax=unclassified Sedimentibacter TaxID=2649220 RepID=UPI0027DF665A|nr:ABC transporter substrate-binding protein [Sedimentibacter sp. MB35-C1]WMJ77577.1 ABC transporter substrate-binding protein [Sedimentibacter sp. MB35-C1]
MKKIVSIITIISIMFMLLVGCTTSAETNEADQDSQTSTESSKIKIGIIQPVEHPSLNQIREYIIKGLEEQGLADRVEITYRDAQGDPSNINTIISQFTGDKMDIIVPIGTGTAQSAAAATKETPVIFAAVSYPVEAGLVEDLSRPEGNVTGVSDAIDVKQIFDLAFEITPDIKTFGFVYNTGEVNSVAAVNKAKEYLDEKGINYVESTITNSSELMQAAQSLAAKSDAIFTPTDNTVASAMPVLASEAQKAGIPVYTGADSLVADGGFATVGIDYTVLGRQVAEMIKKVIEGESIENIPVETLKEYEKIINTSTAEQIGIEISDEALKEFKIVE